MVKLKNLFQNGREFLIKPQSNIFAAAFVIAVTYGVSMVLGILRERILVAKFYLCCREQLDVYYAAFRLPDTIFQLVVIGALSSAFIPVFSEKLAKDQKEAYRLSSSLINLLLVLFFVLSVIIFIFAGPFSTMITGNFSPSQIDLMVGMTRVMLLAEIFFLVSNFFSAIVQSQQRFLLPSLAPIVYNLGIVISVLFLSSHFGIWAATFGVVIGALLHLLIQVPLVIKLGYRHDWIFDWANSGVKKVVKLMVPRTLALAASQIETTFSVFLATSLSAGSLTLYTLAQRLIDLPVRLLGTSIGQAALPTLSLQLAQGKNEEFKKTLGRSLNQILYLAFPSTTMFLILRIQLVRFAYGAKSFPWIATVVTGRTLAVIAFSIFSQSAIQLLIRGFYAKRDTITPFIISIISVLLTVATSLIFVRVLNLEIYGLALAFSISNFINFLLLFLIFNFKKEKFIYFTDVVHWTKMIISSVICAGATWMSLKILDLFVFETTKTLPLLILTLISSSVGVFVYILLSKIFKLEEIDLIYKLGSKLGKWKSALVSVEPVGEVIEPRSGTASGS